MWNVRRGLFLSDSLDSGVAQALLVGQGADPASATVAAWERLERWRRAEGPFRAVMGRNGLALPGEKREGDGKTPSGIFRLEVAFGYGSKATTAMPYRQVGEEDIWVDDPTSPGYNQWRKKGKTNALSFEELRRADGLYEVGIVVGYNRSPVKAGLGSAIFFHVWADEDKPTSGCVAMSRGNMLTILSWLDPTKHPVAVLGWECCGNG